MLDPRRGPAVYPSGGWHLTVEPVGPWSRKMQVNKCGRARGDEPIQTRAVALRHCGPRARGDEVISRQKSLAGSEMIQLPLAP